MAIRNIEKLRKFEDNRSRRRTAVKPYAPHGGKAATAVETIPAQPAKELNTTLLRAEDKPASFSQHVASKSAREERSRIVAALAGRRISDPATLLEELDEGEPFEPDAR